MTTSASTIIKGFVQSSPFMINDKKMMVSAIGELSDKGRGFTTDLKEYTPVNGNCTLLVHNYTDSNKIKLSKDLTTYEQVTISSILDEVYRLSASLVAGDEVNFDSAMATFLGSNAIKTNNGNITVSLGGLPLITGIIGDGSSRTVPTKLTITSVGVNVAFVSTFWFSDEVFTNTQDGYDEVDYVVVLPFDDRGLDLTSKLPSIDAKGILSDKATMGAIAVDARDITLYQKKVAMAMDAHGHPGDIVAQVYTWHDSGASAPVTGSLTASTIPASGATASNGTITDMPFAVLVYGRIGSDAHSVRSAIRNTILHHSTHSASQWGRTYPGLFSADGYIIVPQWNSVAVSGVGHSADIFSKMFNPSNWLQRLAPAFPTLHGNALLNTATFIGTGWQNMGMVVCGDPINSQLSLRFDTEYPDYVGYTVGSVLNHGSPRTSVVAKEIAAIIQVANDHHDVTNYRLPTKYDAIVLGGLTYITFVIDFNRHNLPKETNVLLTVLSKSSYLAEGFV